MCTLRLAAVAAVALALGGCAPTYSGGARPLEPDTVDRDWTAIRSLPAQPQHAERDCGAAAMASVLSYWGLGDSVETIDRAVRPPGAAGASAGVLRDYARGRGLRAYLIRGRVADLEHELARNRPVIVGTLKRYGKRTAYEHYQVVFAISGDRSTIATYDPADGWRRYSRADFLAEWKPTGKLTLVVLPGALARD